MTLRNSTVVAAFLLATLFGACASADEHVESAKPLEVPFESTISDSLIAATVEFAGHVDTLTAIAFRANLERLNSLFPEVMESEERSAPIRQEMVRQYALERLLLGEAARRGLEADSLAIEKELQRYRNRFESEEAFRNELDDIHQTEDDLRAQLVATVARDSLVRSLGDSLPPASDDEIESFQARMSTRLRVQHILVSLSDDASQAERDDARQTAVELIDSLESGRPFAMLARRFSDDPGSKVSGGELPWFRRGEMVTEFENAAFDLDEQGEYTRQPVRTPYGYHIIRLLDRVQDNVITVDSAGALLKKRRVREAHGELQRRLVENAVIRTNPTLIPPSGATVE